MREPRSVGWPEAAMEEPPVPRARPGSTGPRSTRWPSTPLSLAVDPSTPSTAVAGSAIGGLFVTVDSGQTWTHVASTVLPPKVGTVTMDPTDGQIVYAGGCSGLCFLGGKSGLFKSTDG